MTAITNLNPDPLLIGDTLQVDGEIDSPGGAFTILLDENVLHQGTAAAGETTISHGFTIPSTPPTLHYIKLIDDASGEWDRKHFRVRRPGSCSAEETAEGLPATLRRFDTQQQEVERVEFTYDVRSSRN